MQIADLLELDEAGRRTALDRNMARLRRKTYRHDAAAYLEEMLAELHQIAGKAGFRKVAVSIDQTRKDVQALLAAGSPASRRNTPPGDAPQRKVPTEAGGSVRGKSV